MAYSSVYTIEAFAWMKLSDWLLLIRSRKQISVRLYFLYTDVFAFSHCFMRLFIIDFVNN